MWEGSYNGTGASTAQELSDSIFNYDKLLITFDGKSTSTDNNKQTFICNPSDVTAFNRDIFRLSVFANSSSWTSVAILFSDSTHFYGGYYGTTSWSAPYITKIQGIRKAKPIVSSGMKYETLWEGNEGSLTSDYNTNLQLSTTINKYSKLGFELKTCNPANTNDIKIYYQECSVSQIISLINGGNGNILFTAGYGTWVNNFNIYSTSTPSNLVVELSKTLVTKIIGISEGVQIPTGVQAARVELWSGSYSTSNESGDYSNFSNTQSVSDDISNYDEIEITLSAGDNIGQFVFDTEKALQHKYLRTFIIGGSSYMSMMTIIFSSSTNFGIAWKSNQGMESASITKIVGIKYIQPDSYSTEEKLIGTWIDGKPLYRKVFTGLSITLQWNDKYFAFQGDISLPLSNVDTLVSANGYGDNFSMPVTIDINRTTNLFGIRGVDTWTINSLAVEYTKN